MYISKHSIIVSILFSLFGGHCFAQSPSNSVPSSQPARSPLKAITSTQYTTHTELFAEFRPLLLNTPARFTAHLTQIAESFKPYNDAEVALTLTIDGKIVWQQTQKQPVAPGTYRFPIKAEVDGKGTVTITLKMPTYSEQFVIENVIVYADEAIALASQAKQPVNERMDEIAYHKEKSWLENFATASVNVVKKSIMIPQTAILTENEIAYVFVQNDPEHFKKQIVKTGKRVKDIIEITSGLKPNDRIVTLGADRIK